MAIVEPEARRADKDGPVAGVFGDGKGEEEERGQEGLQP